MFDISRAFFRPITLFDDQSHFVPYSQYYRISLNYVNKTKFEEKFGKNNFFLKLNTKISECLELKLFGC